jgi:hypothetical protein|tara:strand:- start:138 stop:275 length:138 start_codon:yes stop_codon:yes gene_type:complete
MQQLHQHHQNQDDLDQLQNYYHQDIQLFVEILEQVRLFLHHQHLR